MIFCPLLLNSCGEQESVNNNVNKKFLVEFTSDFKNEYFINERISYDISTGRFGYSGDHIRSVIVEGDVAGKEYTAVCRALGRCAVDVETPEAASGSSVLKVVVKGNGRFCLHHPDASEENFTSVEHLLTALLSAMSKLRISLLSEETPEP